MAVLDAPTLRSLPLEDIPCYSADVYPSDSNDAHYIRNKHLIKDAFFKRQLDILNDYNNDAYLKLAVKNLNSTANPGLGIHMKLINSVFADAFDIFAWFYRICWRSTHFPLIFQRQLLNPIHKTSLNPHFWESYREINMSGSFRKIQDAILNYKLIKFLIKCNLLSPHTMGALRGKSCGDAVNILQQYVRKGWSTYTPTYALITDISKCYPSINYRILLTRLYQYYGITGCISTIILNSLLNSWTTTMVNGICSDWNLQMCGLGQGRSNSPLLNLLFIDPITQVIFNRKIFKMMVYIDDLIVFTILNHVYDRSLNDMWNYEIQQITNWLTVNKLSLSIRKTKAITFYNNIILRHYPDRIITITIAIEDQIISFDSTHIKYLGHFLQFNLRPVRHINAIISKLSGQHVTVRKSLRNMKTLKMSQHHDIGNAFFLSIIRFYITSVFKPTLVELRPLETCYRSIVRSIFRFKYTTPIEIMFLLCGWDTIRDLLTFENAKLWNRYLHISVCNPIYKLMNDEWYYHWKNRTKLHSQLRKSPLSQVMHSAQQMKLPHLFYIKDRFYNDHWRDVSYISRHLLIPQNLNTQTNQYTIYSSINFRKGCLFVFGDGSLMDGTGGLGIVLARHIINDNHTYKPEILLDNSFFAGTCHDITHLELFCIKLSLKTFVSVFKHYKHVVLVSDNKPAVDWIKQLNISKWSYINQLLKQIYRVIRNLPQIQFYIMWCKRNTNYGSIRADMWAKYANQHQDEATDCHSFDPIISKASVKTILSNKRKDFTRQRMKIYNGKFHIFGMNIANWNITEYDCRKEMKIFTDCEFAILSALRSEHIDLNLYQHIVHHLAYYRDQKKYNAPHIQYLICDEDCCKDISSGLCPLDNKRETVYHFVMECGRYIEQRFMLFYSLRKIFGTKQIILKDILFPINFRWFHRKLILRAILDYVSDTGRF
eukprot:771000_1